MDQRDIEIILGRLVKIGTVTDVDQMRHMVRVKFQNEDDTSGWLYVVQHNATAIAVKPDGVHDHTTISDTGHSHTGAGGSGYHSHTVSEEPNHNHDGTVTTWWMPNINDTVLVLYLPLMDSDGFILGGIAHG